MSRARWFLVVVAALVSGAVTACHAPSMATPSHTPVATVQVVKPATFAPSTTAPARRSVRVAEATDRSNRLAVGARRRVTQVLERRMERTGYAISAGAGLVVTPSVTAVEIVTGREVTISCTVAVRVAPATTGGGELWEARRTATATGAATAIASTRRPQHVARSVEDCIATASEEALTRRILPFLEGALAGS